MPSVFGFNTDSEEIAFAIHYGHEVVCYIPQYGGWYETRHYVNQEVEELEFCQTCIAENMVRVVGDGAHLVLSPGEFHPRIWRGVFRRTLTGGYDKLNPGRVYGQTYMRSIVAAESLFSEVKALFGVVEPQTENFGTFGHRFRELLILLCTEIEACWSGVLKANDMEVQANGRFTTKNYLKVCTPLRLTEWTVRLNDYDTGDFHPFRRWNILQPSASLPWYEAYNKVKHDREGNFHMGTMHNVLQAAAALHIMQVAQFGPGIFDIMRGNRSSIFYVAEGPVFDLSEIYISDPIEKGQFHTEIKIGGIQNGISQPA